MSLTVVTTSLSPERTATYKEYRSLQLYIFTTTDPTADVPGDYTLYGNNQSSTYYLATNRPLMFMDTRLTPTTGIPLGPQRDVKTKAVVVPALQPLRQRWSTNEGELARVETLRKALITGDTTVLEEMTSVAPPPPPSPSRLSDATISMIVILVAFVFILIISSRSNWVSTESVYR